ncbi:MAG TPA: prephenate dehydrogenase/arogenate dehydrogenase family protein, partial [Acidimicrobiales bacterium]|nr:prephenate dehydrogenase/arogenate dehydrogenase family protein [Acidimicrobiales bacterium]
MPGPETPEPGPGPPARRAQIVGTGLIGGSIGAALRRRGWVVTGDDVVATRAERAVELGAADHAGRDTAAQLVFVATPAGAVPDVVAAALDRHPGAVVTDVAGVKGPVVARIADPRFVGGHPMAGSEQEGVDGSDPEMFEGATWVLTPEAHTDPLAFTTVRAAVSSLGANVV